MMNLPCLFCKVEMRNITQHDDSWKGVFRCESCHSTSYLSEKHWQTLFFKSHKQTQYHFVFSIDLTENLKCFFRLYDEYTIERILEFDYLPDITPFNAEQKLPLLLTFL